MTDLDFTTAGRQYLSYVAYLKRWLPKAIALVRKPPKEISIVLVGDTKMAALHEKFLSIPGTTDVLTFEIDHDRCGRIIAGEIIICASYAKREAARRATDAERELLLYALHGVLHLSGYDDKTPAGHQRMHREEDRILVAIGVGAVFRASSEVKLNN